MKKILFGLFFLNAVACSSQVDCNRSVWIKRFENVLPKEICIPEGYHITEIYQKVDMNMDNRKDFIFDWNKQELQDGDTVFVSIYIQKSDSTYEHLKTFNNLYPIYFKNYSTSYNIPDPTLNRLKERYGGFNILKELKFEDNSIVINFIDNTGGSNTGLKLIYVYDIFENNWFLGNKERWWSLEDYEIEDLEVVEEQSIDEFNYFDYIAW